MVEPPIKFEIGFAGGSVAGTAPSDQVSALADAVAAGRDELVSVTSESSRLVVRTGQVAWLRTAQREARVGF